MTRTVALSRFGAVAALLAACAPGGRSVPQSPVPVAAETFIDGALEPVAVVREVEAPARDVPPVSAPVRVAMPHVHLAGTTFDLDVHAYEEHERVRHYVRLFTGDARTTFTHWLGRGTRYDAMIRAKLRAGGLPEDLRFLPLVESGYDPQAVSRASAVGMWQFMAPTARELGLRVDWWVDERRDPVRATDAAVRMMRWLRGEFGSLFVAAAAYNGGPGRVSRGLAQLIAADDSALGDARFFALSDHDYLRTETKNYVPQLIAAALVGNELSRYGMVVRPQAPFVYDTVTVAALTPLAAVATATRASRDELLALNPQLLRGLTPPETRTMLRVPLDASAGFATRLGRLDARDRRAFRRVVTRRRDTMAAIAAREDVPLHALDAFNASLRTVATGKWKGRLISGQAVRVPTAAVLAYARPFAEGSEATGELPAMPAPAAALTRIARADVADSTDAERDPKRGAKRQPKRVVGGLPVLALGARTPRGTDDVGDRTTRVAARSLAKAGGRARPARAVTKPSKSARSARGAPSKGAAKTAGKAAGKGTAKARSTAPSRPSARRAASAASTSRKRAADPKATARRTPATRRPS